MSWHCQVCTYVNDVTSQYGSNCEICHTPRGSSTRRVKAVPKLTLESQISAEQQPAKKKRRSLEDDPRDKEQGDQARNESRDDGRVEVAEITCMNITVLIAATGKGFLQLQKVSTIKSI